MLFINTNNIVNMIKANLEHRTFNIKKYLDWLEINENTPVLIKLKVLDMCMLPAYLYGAETWWEIDKVADLILVEERRILKRILGVKNGTSNDIVYIELYRPDIISKIKDLQYKFYEKMISLKPEDAIIAKALNMCNHLNICKYYEELRTDNQKRNKEGRITYTRNSTSSMNCRYKDLFDLKTNEVIYSDYVNGKYRIILTRWRLSNINIRIETGRYQGRI